MNQFVHQLLSVRTPAGIQQQAGEVLVNADAIRGMFYGITQALLGLERIPCSEITPGKGFLEFCLVHVGLAEAFQMAGGVFEPPQTDCKSAQRLADQNVCWILPEHLFQDVVGVQPGRRRTGQFLKDQPVAPLDLDITRAKQEVAIQEVGAASEIVFILGFLCAHSIDTRLPPDLNGVDNVSRDAEDEQDYPQPYQQPDVEAPVQASFKLTGFFHLLYLPQKKRLLREKVNILEPAIDVGKVRHPLSALWRENSP